MRIEKAVRIAAPPERVFKLLAEAKAQPRWQRGLERVEYEGPIRPGTAFTQYLRESDRTAVYRGTVTAYERPWHFGVRIAADRFVMDVDYHLEGVPEGTRVAYVASAAEQSRTDRFLGLVFNPLARRMAAKRLGSLKRLAEENRPVATPGR